MDHSFSKWRQIIILDKNHKQINSYKLDKKARLLIKLKRQKRRDLGKMTGKKALPKNWKQTIEELDDNTAYSQNSSSSSETSNFSNDSVNLFSETMDHQNSPSISSSSSSEQIQENSNFHNDKQMMMSFEDLISIDWLLNQPQSVTTI